MAQNQHDNIKALRAQVAGLMIEVERLRGDVAWVHPKPGESYTAWVERLIHTASMRKVA